MNCPTADLPTVLLAGTSADLSIGDCGMTRRMKVQVAGPNDEAGLAAAREFLRRVETEVLHARSYRGKILSLVQDNQQPAIKRRKYYGENGPPKYRTVKGQ